MSEAAAIPFSRFQFLRIEHLVDALQVDEMLSGHVCVLHGNGSLLVAQRIAWL